MGAVVLASAAPVAYVTGFAIFKTTASRMPRLAGSRPFHTTRHLALSPVWLFGLFTLVTGLVTQSIVMTELPVHVVVPMYGPVMLVLLLISVANFGERVQAGERRALSVLLTALLALAAAGGLLSGDDPPAAGTWNADAPLWKIGLIVGPSVLLTLWLFTIRDRPVEGRHAKRMTGVAFGMGAGIVVGCAESSGASLARMMRGQDNPYQWDVLLQSPHPYIVVVAGLFGVGLATIGLQRCRLSVVIVVLAVCSKASLWLTGILAYGASWPETRGQFFLTGVGLILAVTSVVLLPRHEPEDMVFEEVEAAEPETAEGQAVRGRVSPI